LTAAVRIACGALTVCALGCGGGQSTPANAAASSGPPAGTAASGGANTSAQATPGGAATDLDAALARGRQTSSGPAEAKLAGIAFVDSSVTGMGAKAKLPPGATIYPPGSRVTGASGCPTNRYGTDGQMVLVIDYSGRPTAANVVARRTDANVVRPPYYIDLDAGRTLQFLGPEHGNGTYHVTFGYHLEQGREATVGADFTLDRTCPAVQ